eukprot:superscaffoldBa00005436_g20344
MLTCLEHMYHDLGLVKDFNINPITLKRWLLCIHDNYRNNPFHNFRHCFCVTQMMYSMICLCSLQTDWEMFDHDVDHVLKAAMAGDVGRELRAMSSNIWSIGPDCYGKKKLRARSNTNPKENRRLKERATPRGEATEDEKPAFPEIQDNLRERIKILNPFEYVAKILGDKRSGELKATKEEVREHLCQLHSDSRREDSLEEMEKLITPAEPTIPFRVEEPSWWEDNNFLKVARLITFMNFTTDWQRREVDILTGYQINARTELAVRYNDISPLENHHCAVAFQIFSQPDCNIFSHFDPEAFKQIRQGTITLILATDMARHGEILDSFKQKVDNFHYTDEEHVTCLKMVLIKCCDISNEVRPMEVAEPWVDCLLEEYFMQSDREKSEGLPVAPFMDREKVTKPTAQIGFIKFVLIPMFETVMKLFPQIEEAMVAPLRDSRDRYEELKQIDDAMNEVQKKKTENLTMGGKKK